MNYKKKTTTIYNVDTKLTDKEIKCFISIKELGIPMVELSWMEVDNNITLNREYFISFGSSHVYSWMNGVNPLKILLRVLAPSMEEARSEVIKTLGDRWSTSYSNENYIDGITTIIKFEDIKEIK